MKDLVNVQRLEDESRPPHGLYSGDSHDIETRPESTMSTSWSAAEIDAAIGRKSRRRWPWLLAAAVIIGGVTIALTARGSSGAGDELVADVVNTAEVVTTDLVEIDTLDGTLGRVVADPISSLKTGVLTYVAAAGDVVGNGEVLYRVEGEPVVLLTGEAPPYRDMALTSGTHNVLAGVSGTITAMAAEGDVIDQGDVIFEINGEPVIALYGEMPAYRTMQDLATDITGVDVAQLESALASLGYTGFTVDDQYSDATETAVEEWQEDIGADSDGIVNLGEVFFIPGPSIVTGVTAVGAQLSPGQAAVVVATEPLSEGIDVAQLEAALIDLGYGNGITVDGIFTAETREAVLAWQAAIGADTDGIVDLGEVYFAAQSLRINDQLVSLGATVGNGSPVLAITAADIVVKVDLSADDQGLVAAGDSVVVVLPGNVEVPATVDRVSTIATFDNQGNAVFEVVISLDDNSAAAGLDEAPVDVDVISDSVTGVVAVPVAALVALAEGGYAVEVQQADGSTVLVAVEPGFYADGLVEVTDTQVVPGMRVVVP